MRTDAACERESRPKALFLAPETPYPLAGGGALRSASLFEYLTQHYDVDVITFRQPGAEDPARQFPPRSARRIAVINLPLHGRGLAARSIRNAVRVVRRVPPLVDRFSGFEEQVAAAVEGEAYEIGVIEHFWCASYWSQIRPVCRRTVLDLHNIESILHRRCAQVESGPPAMAHELFAASALERERVWLPRFSEILTTSEGDAEAVRERAPRARVTVYPNAIPLPPLPALEGDFALVFSGNLEYHPNVSAVRFFRQQVWPQLRERWPGLVWRLIGKNPEAVRPWTAGDDRIEMRGAVADAIPELARAQIAIAPILAGSGTRLKILEAWGAGLPVVSTTLGAEGLPVEDGRDLLLADGGVDFANAVTKLIECRELRRELGQAGRRLLESRFTWEQAWKTLSL